MSSVNEVNMAKWIVALRSGKYTQGREKLHPTPDTFCCLGVACDVSGLGEWTKDGEYSTPRDQCEGALTEDVAAWLGIFASNPALDPGGRGCIYANDIEELTFAQIADSLEATYLPGKKAEEIPLRGRKVIQENQDQKQNDLGSTEKVQEQTPQTRILPTTAGRELDALVADKVMGLRVFPSWNSRSGHEAKAEDIVYPFAVIDRVSAKDEAEGIRVYGTDYCDGTFWFPSRVIGHAWPVLEHLEIDERRILSEITRKSAWDMNDRLVYEVVLRQCTIPFPPHWVGQAFTAPLAICLAALQTVVPTGAPEK